ncbi:unnamed protein product [Peronospora farinosa]|uniref:Integrase catalytic domain-containing protein n=1 Tax=Peronospora farinosa TaxID=134698 RepID=A0AAV0T3J3_9STRA|nr:unnamed protein product [Peronospora farinosa]
MSITSASQKYTSSTLAGPTALTEAASVMMVQARLLQTIELASVPQIQQLFMSATNAVLEASAMIATFPLELQATLVNEEAVAGEDNASTIVTATPNQIGILTHHNKELHNLLQTFQHDVTTVRDQRNALQDTVNQLIEHLFKLIEDIANQRIQFNTQLNSKTAEATAANTALVERTRALQEQIERAEQHNETALNNCRAEHQVVAERFHQEITRLLQRSERLQSEHVKTMVALTEHQTISQSAQDSLACTLQAEHEIRDQLTKSIDHYRVAQEEALSRITEAQHIKNFMEIKLVQETARANAAEDRLTAEIATRASLEERLQSLQYRYEVLLRDTLPPLSTHTSRMDRDQPSPINSENLSINPAHQEAQVPLPTYDFVPPRTQRSPAPTQNTPPPQNSGSSPGLALSPNLSPDPSSPSPASSPVLAPPVLALHTVSRIKEVKCEMFTGKDKYPGLGGGFDLFMRKFKQAILSESRRNNSTYTDELRETFLVTFLDGAASDFYFQFLDEFIDSHNRNPSYQEVQAALREEFRCKLSQSRLSDYLNKPKKPEQTWHGYYAYLRHVGKEMGGDQNALILEAFCKNASTDPGIQLQLASVIDYNATNINDEINKAFTLLTKLLGDGRKSSSHSQRSSNAKANINRASAASVTASTQVSAKPKLPQYSSTSRSRPKDGIKPCWVCKTTEHKTFDCPVIPDAQRRVGQASVATAVSPTDHAAESYVVEGADDTIIDSTGECFFLGSAEECIDHGSPLDSPTPNAFIGADACIVLQSRDAKLPTSTKWLIDSGATHHFTNNAAAIITPTPSFLRVRVANGSVLQAVSKGSVLLKTITNGTVTRFVLTDVHYVPAMPRNLLSVSKLIDQDFVVSFSRHCTLSTDDRIIARAPRELRLWSLSTISDTADEAAAFLARIESSTLRKWHERLGHLNYQNVVRMADKWLAAGIKLTNRTMPFCLQCAEAKQTRNRQGKQDTSRSAPTDEVGAVIGLDLKINISSVDRKGHKHVLTIVDYASGYNYVYLLKTKNEAFDKFVNFHANFQRQFDVRVKCIRSDPGGEFVNDKMRQYLQRHGILHQTTETDTSVQNGKAERFHRTLFNTTRAMLWSSGMQT